MRKLIAMIALLASVGCASVPTAVPQKVKQVEPLSEVVILQCHKFYGAVVVLPDGSLEALTDEKAARAVYDALPSGHVGVVNTGEPCAPLQST